MKERPIIFNGEMVRAILDGRKTQTRRPVDLKKYPQYPDQLDSLDAIFSTFSCQSGCPFGKVGDRLWVRETFHIPGGYLDQYQIDEIKEGISIPKDFGVIYHSDFPGLHPFDGGWQPSVHMKREASRITLGITDVRVQRLQDISEEEAISEGIESTIMWLGVQRYKHYNGGTSDLVAIKSFASLWDSMYSEKYPWESNPWVWVIEFERVEGSHE